MWRLLANVHALLTALCLSWQLERGRAGDQPSLQVPNIVALVLAAREGEL